MPEAPPSKIHQHPKDGVLASHAARPREPGRVTPYVELQTTTNFTFLTGASHPEEFVEEAARLEHAAAAITDCNTLAGIVRAHVAGRHLGMPVIVGCRLEFASRLTLDGAPSGALQSMLVYPTDRAAYGRLCRLLTLGRRRAPKGDCYLCLHDVLDHHEGLLGVVIPPRRPDQDFLEMLAGLHRTFGDDRLSLAASCHYGGDDRGRLRSIVQLASHAGVPLVAVNDVHYHVAGRRPLQDVVTCIRHGTTITAAGYRLCPNAERHLKPGDEMARLFAGHGGSSDRAIRRTVDIAERARGFSLDELRYDYPEEVCPPGRNGMQHLRELTDLGLRDRYPGGAPERVRKQVQHELGLIDELAYAPYFLTVHDIVVFARGRRILCQGRGAAANSAVCYCLGITAVDPARTDLLFERFVSRERDEPPDIDIDFEHERREEVIQYLYRKYGRDRAALTAEVITYRGRSAVREVGKAMGLSLDAVDRLARNIDWWHDGVGDPSRVRELGFDPNEPSIRRVLALTEAILGFPRHLSQHVGGFVITQSPLCELVPIENAAMPDRTVIEWDKDDIDAMGMLKVDCLGLGMLTCIRKSFAMVNEHRAPGQPKIELHTVPPEDPAVYDMVCAADTVGVFQIESRAQMSMLPRLRPRCFYDLVIEVAIVRPGPIQGDMVHPYLRRRNGEEPVSYPDERVRRVLEKTLGVPLFQEQAMSLAIVAAGFTPGEADALRRSMAAWKRSGNQIEKFRVRFLRGMSERGYDPDFAARCFRQIEGFSEYGFPESHAASFALLVYVSAWLKRHHPAAFAASLLNSLPMGFYAPAQIVRDARIHGVEVRPVDVNASGWDCRLECGADETRTRDARADVTEEASGRGRGGDRKIDKLLGSRGAGASRSRSAASFVTSDSPALRLGMRLVKGLREDESRRIEDAVAAHGVFTSIAALHRASGVRVEPLRRLAGADAFGSMGLDRQRALWQVRSLADESLPMFDDVAPPPDRETTRIQLPPVAPAQQVVDDYAATHLSLKAHPMSFVRDHLRERHVLEASTLRDERACPNGRPVAVAGLVLVRQRPSTAKGVIFMTLEDETDIANLIFHPETYARFRPVARHGTALIAHGRVERAGEVVHVMVQRVEGLDDALAVSTRSRDFR